LKRGIHIVRGAEVYRLILCAIQTVSPAFMH
jgi:hypothetical protein